MQQVFKLPECIKKDAKYTFCPGCGHGIALRLLGEAIDEAENISHKPKPVVFEIVELVESRFNRIVTPTEVDIIKMWIEKDVTKLEIEQALIECVKAKKTTCQYADAIIVNRQNQKQRVSTNYDPKIKEVLDLFDARYKK